VEGFNSGVKGLNIIQINFMFLKVILCYLWLLTCFLNLSKTDINIHLCHLYRQRVWPLSLLALHATVVYLSLPREQIHLGSHVTAKELLSDEVNRRSDLLNQPSSVSEAVRNDRQCSEIEWQIPGKVPCLQHPKLHHVFRKHVKPKKQHEMSRMAEV
jgi:hypothetical protein